MASTLVKLYVHIIFHVKTTSPKLRGDDLDRVFQYIGGIVRGMDGIPLAVGGMNDHVHILTTLPKQTTLSDFVRNIKSESSRWIKDVYKAYNGFSWQNGYGAFSVSSSAIDKTVEYIGSQAEHHRKRTFREEYKMFLEAYGIEFDERYAFAD